MYANFIFSLFHKNTQQWHDNVLIHVQWTLVCNDICPCKQWTSVCNDMCSNLKHGLISQTVSTLHRFITFSVFLYNTWMLRRHWLFSQCSCINLIIYFFLVLCHLILKLPNRNCMWYNYMYFYNLDIVLICGS